MKVGGLFLFSIFFSGVLLGADNEVTFSERVFSVKLSASRIIYDLGGRGQSLLVENSQPYPILVHSAVYSEDKKNDSGFSVTPPLAKVDSLKSLRVRILDVKGDYPQDRESLKWLCVKGVPPSNDSIWSDKKDKPGGVDIMSLVSAKTCIKLLIRPPMLRGRDSLQSEKVSWHANNNKLMIKNDSPFYLNLSHVEVAGKNIDFPAPVPPYSTVEHVTPVVKSELVKWQAINDLGGASYLFESVVK
ncbi:fimbria/pilus periplasmic chaperone [Aeromonas veronii]